MLLWPQPRPRPHCSFKAPARLTNPWTSRRRFGTVLLPSIHSLQLSLLPIPSTTGTPLFVKPSPRPPRNASRQPWATWTHAFVPSWSSPLVRTTFIRAFDHALPFATSSFPCGNLATSLGRLPPGNPLSEPTTLSPPSTIFSKTMGTLLDFNPL